jgi:CPA1 family monovalent cation:H+ antiporter
LRPIGLLSIGLVIFTTAGIAVVAHAVIPGIPWAVAAVLGAIVAPTDSVAATAILGRMGAPRRIVTILEGEALVNDASGLVAYRFAVAAVTAGTFSIAQAGLQFVLVSLGGVAVGLALGWLLVQVDKRIEDPLIEIALSFLTPYGAYLAAENVFHVSGVLAVVAAALYFSWNAHQVLSATTRVQAIAVWDMVVFVLNGLAFILIGLQLPSILDGLGGRSVPVLATFAVAIVGAVIVMRFLWVFPGAYLPRLIPAVARMEPPIHWRNVIVVAWTGMRGVVSLAAALALVQSFPDRDLILFLTFCVILATLVLQGLSLPFLLRALRVSDDGSDREEEADARFQALDAAVAHLEILGDQAWVRDEMVQYMRTMYGKRRVMTATRFGRLTHDHQPDGHHHADGVDHAQDHLDRQESLLRLKREMVAAERTEILRLRDMGSISGDALRRIERDLDLEEVRLIEA